MPRDDTGHASVTGVLDRPRLYAILDSPHVQVCIVQGPSGSGKTTLLRSWALTHGEPLTWVALGDGTVSRQAFWLQVVGSARRLGVTSTTATDRAIEQLGVRADPVRLAIELLADAGPVTLVVDAYERLGDASTAIDTDLGRLIAALPELRLLITTRGGTALSNVDPPAGVTRLIALGELTMTGDEVGALVLQQTGIDDARLTASVAEGTRGFPLSVRAAVLALAQLGRIPEVDSIEWDVDVAERWASLLPDESAVSFVTDTSVPPYLDRDLARTITGRSDVDGTFDALERNGFGRWIPFARNRPVFQYAEPIRAVFRARAADDVERFRRTCLATARWFFDNREVDQAMGFAIEAEDYAFADRAFVSLVVTNPDSYITDRFLATLQRVPESALAEHPMLAFGLGLALTANPALRLDAPRVFHIAIESPAQPTYIEPSIDAFSLDAMRAVSRRLAYAFRESAEHSLEVVRSVDRIPPEVLARHSDHVGTILRQVSYSLLQGGAVEDAIVTATRSARLCSTPTSRSYSTVYAAGAAAFAGDQKRARAFTSSIEASDWPPHLQRTYLNALGVIAEAFLRLDDLDFAGAVTALRSTNAFTPTGEFWPFFTAISVSARHGLGQARAEAERVTYELSGVRPPGIGDNVATEHLHAALARAWLTAGDHRAAGALLDAQAPGRPHLTAARAARLLADERPADALELVTREIESIGHTPRTRAETWTVGAVAAARQGERQLAWSWLTSAAVAWETYGPRLHVALLPARDRRLLRELAHEGDVDPVLRFLDIPAPRPQAGPSIAVDLTPREAVVLRALAERSSTREIAESLVVSPHTVKTQLHSLYRKLGVTSRRSAIVVATELGLLSSLTTGDRARHPPGPLMTQPTPEGNEPAPDEDQKHAGQEHPRGRGE